jgi:hypothetical protein
VGGGVEQVDRGVDAPGHGTGAPVDDAVEDAGLAPGGERGRRGGGELLGRVGAELEGGRVSPAAAAPRPETTPMMWASRSRTVHSVQGVWSPYCSGVTAAITVWVWAKVWSRASTTSMRPLPSV